MYPTLQMTKSCRKRSVLDAFWWWFRDQATEWKYDRNLNLARDCLSQTVRACKSPTGSRVLFKPNGSEIWHPSCLSQTGQSLQDDVPYWYQGHFNPPRSPGTEPHSKPLTKYVENDPLATYSGHLKGGVRDPILAGPAYIEGLHLSKHV